MSVFEFITVAVSFLLGLGISRLLLGAAFVFQARRTFRFHWVPAVWALSIFFIQIQFWWGIYELEQLVSIWTLTGFVTLVLAALLLFLAGELVLPTKADCDDLMAYFDETGRWSLLVLIIVSANGLWMNWYLFNLSPIGIVGLMLVVLAAFPAMYLLVENQIIQRLATITYFVLAMVTLAVASRTAY